MLCLGRSVASEGLTVHFTVSIAHLCTVPKCYSLSSSSGCTKQRETCVNILVLLLSLKKALYCICRVSVMSSLLCISSRCWPWRAASVSHSSTEADSLGTQHSGESWIVHVGRCDTFHTTQVWNNEICTLLFFRHARHNQRTPEVLVSGQFSRALSPKTSSPVDPPLVGPSPGTAGVSCGLCDAPVL